MTGLNSAVPTRRVLTESLKKPPSLKNSINFYESYNLLQYSQDLLSRPHIQQGESTARFFALFIEQKFTIMLL
jgi:hypothetical protein